MARGGYNSVKIENGERIFTIYKATNTINGKIYIGQTVEELKNRRSAHITRANSGSRYCFHNAIRKYGPDTFIWEAIFFCYSKKEADAKESEFILSLNTKVPVGYNMTDGGEGTLGCSPSKETREKISRAQKEYIQRTGKIFFLGKKHTPEARAKITAIQTGKKRGPHSTEHREKIRNALLGRKMTEEQKNKIRKTLTGFRHSLETREKSRKIHTGMKHTDEARENMRKAWVKRKQNPDFTFSGHSKINLSQGALNI